MGGKSICGCFISVQRILRMKRNDCLSQSYIFTNIIRCAQKHFKRCQSVGFSNFACEEV